MIKEFIFSKYKIILQVFFFHSINVNIATFISEGVLQVMPKDLVESKNSLD